jgi:hypothetical protein
VEWILTLHLSFFFFSGSYLGVFENFAKKDKVPRMVPSIAQVVFVTSPKALSEPQLPTLWLVCGALGRITCDSLVPHDVVEPKTGSKKKLVMQLDRDVQVCGIYLFTFLNTPCFGILLLLLFWGVMLSFSLFLCSLIEAHFFSMLLKHIPLFSMTPLSFCKITRRVISLDFGVFFWWMDGIFCVTPGVGVSMYMWVYVISIMEA